MSETMTDPEFTELNELLETWLNGNCTTAVEAASASPLLAARMVDALHQYHDKAQTAASEAARFMRHLARYLERNAPTMNGAQVIGRYKGAVFVRIPRALSRPTSAPCDCSYCKAHPGTPSHWDTLAIPAEAPKTGNDTAWTVHAPEHIGNK